MEPQLVGGEIQALSAELAQRLRRRGMGAIGLWPNVQASAALHTNPTEGAGNTVTMRLSEAAISSIVNAGGGRYVGVLNAIPEKTESIIVFVSPQTRTTLGIPISRLTAEAVRQQLAESDAAFDADRDGSLVSKSAPGRGTYCKP
jgi:hypothetical protein